MFVFHDAGCSKTHCLGNKHSLKLVMLINLFISCCLNNDHYCLYIYSVFCPFTFSSLIPNGLLAMIVYSPVFFLLAYLIEIVEDVGVFVIWTISEGLNSLPPLDHTAVGGGLPRMLEAVITIVSPALTVTPSFISGSIVIEGGSAKGRQIN